MKACNPKGPLVVNVVKLFPEEDCTGFHAAVSLHPLREEVEPAPPPSPPSGGGAPGAGGGGRGADLGGGGGVLDEALGLAQLLLPGPRHAGAARAGPSPSLALCPLGLALPNQLLSGESL